MKKDMWSTSVHSAKSLFFSRKIRFRDDLKTLYTKIWKINDGDKILEIGCGPGALCGQLSKWYPNSIIYGMDYDQNFIDYAKSNIEGVTFITGDINSLPFDENKFDVIISHTVIEFVDTKSFFKEQYRVLKNNGKIIVMSTRNEYSIGKELYSQFKDKNKEKWKGKPIHTAVRKDTLSEKDILKTIEDYKFSNITTDFLAINNTYDSLSVDREIAIEIINNYRQVEIDNLRFSNKGISNDLLDELNAFYDHKIENFIKKCKIWDIDVTMLMIAQANKIKNQSVI